jgi:hypothetical protein
VLSVWSRLIETRVPTGTVTVAEAGGGAGFEGEGFGVGLGLGFGDVAGAGPGSWNSSLGVGPGSGTSELASDESIASDESSVVSASSCDCRAHPVAKIVAPATTTEKSNSSGVRSELCRIVTSLRAPSDARDKDP